MFEDFINAMHNFRTNKTRTILSLLGIIIGVMSVVIVTTMGSTLYASVANQFKDMSMDVITIWQQWNRNTQQPYVILDDSYRKRLMTEIPEIKNVFYASTFNANVNRKDLSVGAKTVSAVEPGRFEALRMELDYGSFFSLSDYASGFQKAVIGDGIAKELFPEGNAVGKTLTLQIGSHSGSQPYNFNFKVIGVLKEKNSWLIRSSQAVYVPRQFYKNQLARAGNSREVNSAEVVLYSAEDGTAAEEKIKKISSEIGGGYEHSVWTYSAKNEFDQFSKLMGMINLVLTTVAGISLLVGGIGIMNIMLVTVTERKREIGIRKALGASNADIRNQFLVESAALTLTGGFAGVILGSMISKFVITSMFPPEFIYSFNLNGTLIAFAVSVSIGIFFGLHPAVKAAKLDPVAALAE